MLWIISYKIFINEKLFTHKVLKMKGLFAEIAPVNKQESNYLNAMNYEIDLLFSVFVRPYAYRLPFYK